MKIPYGLSNFKHLISHNFTYIDKTRYIETLEQHGQYHILLRPRRFGKSLFISMLEYYYDQQHKDDFDALFGQLYIGQHPTPLRNHYQILFMEFSGIVTQDVESVYQDFRRKITHTLQSFFERYNYPTHTLNEVAAEPTPHAQMEYFLRVTKQQKIFLLIDEYDHFANSLLAEDPKLFKTVMGKGGFVRSFYETIKTATQRGIIERLFITGVTPLMLDSLTSGFNIGKNLSFHKSFNAAIGFTHNEANQLLQPVVDQTGISLPSLMQDLTHWYDGYRFHDQAEEALFNSDMLLYFIDNFDTENNQYPEKMLDENIASDYGKIMALFHIGDRETNYQVLDELIHQGTVTARQQRKFDLDKGFDRDDFISLLAYMGFVSLQGKTLVAKVFGLPNQVIREIYFQYFKVELEQRHKISLSSRFLDQAIQTLALDNDPQPLVDELQSALQLLSNRDAIHMDEQHMKSVLLTLLYQFPVYFIQSEREINRKYPDILLLERSPYQVNHQHLIELKYAKKKTKQAGWQAKREEGIEQVKGYLQLPEVQRLDKLSAWVMVTDGERVEVVSITLPI